MATAEAIRELMEQYNENRGKWIVQYGTDAGFDVWFTEQVVGR